MGGSAVARIVVADDQPVVREGFRRIFDLASDLDLVGETHEAIRLLDLCRERRADVLLLGISIPGPGFLETLRLLRSELPRMRVLAIGASLEEGFGVEALKAGAAGYLSKRSSPEVVLHAIRRVRDGKLYVSETVANRLAELHGPGASGVTDRLSPREYQVFLMLGEGLTVGEIAKTLGLSPKTISTHRAHILAKTKLASNAAIVRFVLEHRLME